MDRLRGLACHRSIGSFARRRSDSVPNVDWINAFALLVIGYLIGSVSPARIVGRRIDPTVDVTTYEQPIEGTDAVYFDDAASATLVNLKLGWQYGCLTSILDMLKAIIPMLIARWMWPDSSFDLIVALGVVIGHNWPVYYRFHGGRGESAIYGSMLITDPLAPIVGNVAAMVLGFATGSLHVLRWSGMALMIPWVWWRGATDVGMYLIAANAIYYFALRKDFAQYWGFYRSHVFVDRAGLSDFLDMGSELGAAMDSYSPPALVRRLRQRPRK